VPQIAVEIRFEKPATSLAGLSREAMELEASMLIIQSDKFTGTGYLSNAQRGVSGLDHD